MNYPTRLTMALGAATCIVAASIAATPRLLKNIDAAAIVVPEPRPIQLDLRDLESLPLPEETPDPPKRLIDAGAAAEAPVRDTDLISSADSQAQDMSDAEGDDTKPAADNIDEFDQLGSAATPPAPPPSPETPAAAPPSPAAEAAPAPAEPSPAEELTPTAGEGERSLEPAPTELPENKPETPPASDAKPSETQVAAVQPTEQPKQPEPTPEEKAESKPAERFQVAAAQPQTPQPPAPTPSPKVPVQELRANKGRESGGATNSGFTSFEANKHELGAYMLKVRNAVEREWRTALHLRYSGVSRTDATIKCSIRPDGTLEFVTIVDAGSSLTYAVLCREAIEKAGPFEPFPFDVPEIYRNENLEINWKFSYM